MNAFPKERRFFIHKNLHRIIFIVFLHHIIQESRRSLKNEIDPVVQLVRMPPCHGGGRGFESRPDRNNVNPSLDLDCKFTIIFKKLIR